MRNVKIVMKCICAAYVDSRKKHFETPHDKTNKITFVPSEDSDQPGHPPSLIRVFAVRSMGSLGPNFASGHRSFCGFCHAVAIETTSETIAYGIVTNLHMRN